MKKRITSLHVRPILQVPTEFSVAHGGVFCVVSRRRIDHKFEHLEYWTPEEMMRARTDLLQSDPRPYIFFSIVRGEWYYRRYASSGIQGEYFYLVQYLGGVFYFHSVHNACKFADLVSGGQPIPLDPPKINHKVVNSGHTLS